MTVASPKLENFILRKKWNYGRNGEESVQAHAELAERGQIAPDGYPFPWGTVIAIHTIGEHDIVEYVRDEPSFSGGEYITPDEAHHFHPYTAGRDTQRSCDGLEKAIVTAIARKWDGANSQAASFFFRMVDIDKQEV